MDDSNFVCKELDELRPAFRRCAVGLVVIVDPDIDPPATADTDRWFDRHIDLSAVGARLGCSVSS